MTSYIQNLWADIPGFGILYPMRTRDIDEMSQEAVGRRITALRQAMGLIRAEFARLCGLSPQGLNNYTNGGQLISTAKAQRMCQATGVNYDFIYRGILKDLPGELRELVPERLARPLEPPRQPRKRRFRG